MPLGNETARVTQEAAFQRANQRAERSRSVEAVKNDAKLAAAQTEADRLRRGNEVRRSPAAQTEADRLKSENDAKLAAAQTEADRLKRGNEVQIAAARIESRSGLKARK